MKVSICKSDIIMCFILLLTSLVHPVLAAISTTGNVEPANPATWGATTVGLIGKTADGTMEINGNSDVSNLYGHIGYGAGITGEVVVDGAGSTWTNGSGLFLGNNGDGTLEIRNGGVVKAGNVYMGYVAGSSGEALVDGDGSGLTNAFYFHVGANGGAEVDVINGGLVSSVHGYIGFNAGSTGEVTVNGVGSKWANSGNLVAGYNGDGTLEILNGGLVSIAGILAIDFDGDGDGFIDMATGGMLALSGVADDSLGDFLGLISGTDAIRYWNGSAWDDITNATEGVDYWLDYHTTGDLPGYTMLTVGVVPEPATILLLFAGLPLIRRKK